MENKMGSLKHYTTFSLPVALHQIQNQMNRLFDETTATNDQSSLFGQWIPAVDIEDQANCLIFKFDIPGVDPKNIDVSIENNELIVKGEKETEMREEKKNYFRTERYSGSFYRRLTLPENIDASKISAKDKHGVLEISIPKTKKSNAKKIDIKVEN